MGIPMNDDKVFVYTVKSDSGDNYTPLVYLTRPTKKALIADLRDHTPPEEWELVPHGPGFAGSHVFIELYEVKVRQ